MAGLHHLSVILLGMGALCLAIGIFVPERPRSSVMEHKEQIAIVIAVKETLGTAGLAQMAIGIAWFGLRRAVLVISRSSQPNSAVG